MCVLVCVPISDHWYDRRSGQTLSVCARARSRMSTFKFLRRCCCALERWDLPFKAATWQVRDVTGLEGEGASPMGLPGPHVSERSETGMIAMTQRYKLKCSPPSGKKYTLNDSRIFLREIHT